MAGNDQAVSGATIFPFPGAPDPAESVAASGGGPHDPGMEARVAALEASVARVEITVSRIEGALGNLPTQQQIAALPSRETFRNWGIGLIVALVASALTMGGLFLAASGNQLSAFQAGLSSVEAIVAARQPLPPVMPAPK